MEKSLTVTIDENLIARAKQHAEDIGKTPDELVADYFELIQHARENRYRFLRTRSFTNVGRNLYMTTLAENSSSWEPHVTVLTEIEDNSCSLFKRASEKRSRQDFIASFNWWVDEFGKEIKAKVYVVQKPGETRKKNDVDGSQLFFKHSAVDHSVVNPLLHAPLFSHGSAYEITSPLSAISGDDFSLLLWTTVNFLDEKSGSPVSEDRHHTAQDWWPWQGTFSRENKSEPPKAETIETDLVALLRECDAKGISAANALKEAGRTIGVVGLSAESKEDEATSYKEMLRKQLAERYR